MTKLRFKEFFGILLLVGIFSAVFNIGIPELSAAAADDEDDFRVYQHGIDFVPLSSGKYYAIWASSGNPPRGADANGNWTHDIYCALVDPAKPSINSQAIKSIIAKSEAQEPASSAINSDGHIMITCEDGWNIKNEVGQRYGLYNQDMSYRKAYPRMVMDGGHSGHVTAAGQNFVVFFSEGWVDGGGVDNLGSGDDVYAYVYNTNGVRKSKVKVAVGESTRDWWPLAAGSDSKVLLVWQRFVTGREYTQLMTAVLDPSQGKLIKGPSVLATGVKYYTYNVTYIPTIKRFLVMGTSYEGRRGFAYLVDDNGNVGAVNTNLPAIVREAKAVVRVNGSEAVVVQPTAPTGVMVLSVTAAGINLKKTISDSYEWCYCGTDGIFNPDGSKVYMVGLSPKGLVQKTFAVGQ